MTTNQAAQRYLTECRLNGHHRVSNIELHKYVAKATGQTRKVVSGTLDGTGGQTLINSDWYLRDWHKKHDSSGRVTHCLSANKTGAIIQREMDYNTPEKLRIIQKVISYLPKKESPKLLTLAGVQGNCVQTALKQNPNVQIENIEKEQKILDLWQKTKTKLNIQCKDHHCTLEKFVQTPAFQLSKYDLFFADAMGYMSKTLYKTLTAINDYNHADIFALTVQRLWAFRNGPSLFQDAIRNAYRNDEDAHRQSIVNCLSNYKMIDIDEYQKDVGTLWMEVYIFERDDQPRPPNLEKLHKKLLALC